MTPAVSPARMRLTLATMTLSASMILVDHTAVPLATPEVIRGLNGSVADGQWVLTANILPLAALMVFGGRLGDLLGCAGCSSPVHACSRSRRRWPAPPSRSSG